MAGNYTTSRLTEASASQAALDSESPFLARARRDESFEDTFVGTQGSDDIHGTEAADFMKGRGGNDTLTGDSGDDTVIGGGGSDRIEGDNDNDLLYGSRGSDEILGEADNDIIYGQDGADTAEGGSGDDRIFGGKARDDLLGSDGDDKVFGDEGVDRIEGGDGNDTLFGGSAGDTFAFDGQGFERDIIRDFNDGADRILFESGPDSVDELTITNSSQGAVISYGDEGSQIIVSNVNAGQLTAADFFFG